VYVNDPDVRSPRAIAAHPWLACADLLAAISFFVEVLGFREEWRWGSPPSDAAVALDEVALFLMHNEELAQRVAGSEVSIAVEGVDELYREHIRRGAPVSRHLRDEPWGTREYHVEGPSGYKLRFFGPGPSDSGGQAQ
jgi:catechol 2,3-dioxygenase-like lactoylglutathione lyase family enzyme